MAYLVGFTLFFLASLIIITVNVRTRGKVNIPSLVGKLYLEEHNTLMTTGLHIELQKANLVEFPYGYILAQSIAPGEIVSEGTRLALLTNDNKSIVPVPNIVGSSEVIAQKILANIPVGKTSFSLVIGTVTRIPSDKPAGEVLAQYPPAQAQVIPETPVSLLISEGPEKLKTGYLFPDVRDVHVEILKKISYVNHIPIKIVTTKTYDYKKNGLVEEIDHGSAGAFVTANAATSEMPYWTVKVKKYAEQGEKIFPNSLVWVSVEDYASKGKTATIFEKTGGDAGQYKNPGYGVLEKHWPVYFQGNTLLSIWQGYREKDSIITVEKIDEKIDEKAGEKVLVKKAPPAEESKVDPDYTKKIKAARI